MTQMFVNGALTRWPTNSLVCIQMLGIVRCLNIMGTIYKDITKNREGNSKQQHPGLCYFIGATSDDRIGLLYL